MPYRIFIAAFIFSFFFVAGPVSAEETERFWADIEPAAGMDEIDIEKVKKPSYRLIWDVPAQWKQNSPSHDIQNINITIPAITQEAADAQASIVTLEGDTGGIVANVNRWRDQVDLLPQEEEEIRAQIVPLQGKNGEIATFEILGEYKAILVGVIETPEHTAYIKMMGDKETVLANKKRFERFARSVHYVPVTETHAR